MLIHSSNSCVLSPHEANLLIKYRTFYENQTVLKIREALSKLDLSLTFANDSSTITIRAKDEKNARNAHYAICQTRFFLALPVKRKTTEPLTLSLSLSIHLRDENHYYINLFELAQQSEDSVQFLIDHRAYWSIKTLNILTFLTQIENLSKPGVMKTLKEFVLSREESLSHMIAVIAGLERALSLPDLKTEAKELLLSLAKFDNYKFTSHFILREAAWKALKTVIEESDVQEVFQTIVKTDPRLHLRFNAQNYLDNIDHHRDQFEIEINKRLISQYDFATLSPSNGKTIDFILWANRPYSYQALQELGEEERVQKLLSSFFRDVDCPPQIEFGGYNSLTPCGNNRVGVSEKVHLYSLLKFIGVYTKNQEVFNSIINAFIKVAHGKYLGVLQPLRETLAQLRDNPHVQMPDVGDVPIQHSVICKDAKTSFGIISRQDDADKFKQLRIQALIDHLQSEETNTLIKKLIIRHCAQYFFTQHDYSWVQMEHEIYARRIRPVLEILIENDTADENLRDEAKRLLTLYDETNNQKNCL